MSPAITTTESPSSNVLPSPAIRAQIDARLVALVEAMLAHPQMKAPNRHPTPYHLWDFAMRTEYTLSELDNIEAGRAVRHPGQIHGYRATGKPNPAKARECKQDVFTRSQTFELLITAPPARLAMMGLAAVDVGDEIKAKSKAVLEAFKPIESF
ncbi:hypothetical protein B0T22DRAFT_531682 [Podospora appendiculata]|uniref:Uncharacterized protein n=1 Tax=Podospora appendiculata TaxID=314037 RepID=A0AAE1CFB6_9PEZI|nr:hypothetical protein B0T22DRAFT_531682 [Podospora appendiculata]